MPVALARQMAELLKLREAVRQAEEVAAANKKRKRQARALAGYL
jgi:hypothetical protein